MFVFVVLTVVLLAGIAVTFVGIVVIRCCLCYELLLVLLCFCSDRCGFCWDGRDVCCWHCCDC